MKNCFKITLFILILCEIPFSSFSTPISDIQQKINVAKPGDTIIIPDGEYDGITITFAGKGTKDKPITLAAQTPGKLIITGKSKIKISGTYCVLSGFVFNKVFLRGEIVVFDNADNCRITDCSFIGCGDPKSTFNKIVFMQNHSTNNMVDHCEFTQSISMSVSIKASDIEAGKGNTGNRIAWNYFHDISRLSSNGQEPIQLGQDQASFGHMRLDAIVEHNLFDKAQGDSEIISNKSSGNIIRYNTFQNSKSELTLRGGSQVRVDSNFMINCDSGIRIHGDGHTIVNNYIENCGNGIQMDSSQYNAGQFIDRKTSGTYQAASGCLIVNNTIINVKRSALYFSRFITTVHEGVLRDKTAFDNTFINNLIINPKNFAVEDAGSKGFVYKNNIAWPADKLAQTFPAGSFIIIDPKLEKKEIIFRPIAASPVIKKGIAVPSVTLDFEGDTRSKTPDIGCDEKGKNSFQNHPLTVSDVGPQWLHQK